MSSSTSHIPDSVTVTCCTQLITELLLPHHNPSQPYILGQPCRNGTRHSSGYSIGLDHTARIIHAKVLPRHIHGASPLETSESKLPTVVHLQANQVLLFIQLSYVLYPGRQFVKGFSVYLAIDWPCTAI